MYRILDLFCGAGGAAAGYQRSGFEVVGVDISPQPRYPFAFIQDDALSFLRRQVEGSVRGYGYDAIHASPPCQRYSAMSNCRPGRAEQFPDLIEPVRELLEQTGLPYVIENVEGAPLRNPVWLCGTTFLPVVDFNGPKQVQRHRGFEANWDLPQPEDCKHQHPSFPVYGHSAPGNRPDLRGKGFAEARKVAMGIDWMTRDEISESIPPAYTMYVGTWLAIELARRRLAVA